MILERPLLSAADLTAAGWELKPEGACRGGLCVPLPAPEDGGWDAEMLSARLRMPLVSNGSLWALGPAAGPVLESAAAPDFRLPDWRGEEISLSSLRGQKVFLLAWAPW